MIWHSFLNPGMGMSRKTAIIIGAGPAGLTAAYELLQRTDIKPVVYEQSDAIGGLSRTVEYQGNRIDIGGHRFFTKSDRVMQWWADMLPTQGHPARDDKALGRQVPLSEEPDAPDPEKEDRVMLVRSRLSRILFLRRFFDYPLALNGRTLRRIGVWRAGHIGLSYARARLLPISPEKSLEDFFINRFGRQLYLTFFKSYTEKVWGIPCQQIKPEWGAQRIKGLSISKAILHALKTMVARDRSIAQKGTETSLIGQFLYPKFGPGHMWQETARRIEAGGGEIHFGRRLVGLQTLGDRVVQARLQTKQGEEEIGGDYFFSTMAVKDLVGSLGHDAPAPVQRVAAGLAYRDFITVGLLVDRLEIHNETGVPSLNGIVPDNWIYIQDGDVKLGRLQIFNNWSPYMVADPSKVWLGLEYFCDEGDELWSMPVDQMRRFAAEELEKIGVIRAEAVLDGTVIRQPKAYPAYSGTYDEFPLVRQYLDGLVNLYPVGRNGTHRYNNQDHSMLSAMVAVDNIAAGISDKDNIWSVNTEQEYHESKNGS
jgi:protoporphyrinogen oxidase